MDKELQRYYDARFSLTATEGWKDLIEDATQMHDGVNNVLGITKVEELYFKKGQLDILIWLLNLRETARAAYDRLEAEDKEDARL
jgi:hypothetical protein